VRSALFIGEQVMGNSIRGCLRSDLGIADVTVASFFDMDEALAERSDVHLEGEDDLTALAVQNHYELIIGDPLYQELVPSSLETRMVDFPHVALSSRLHWDRKVDFVGEAGAELLERAIFGRAVCCEGTGLRSR
jgi:hypothetical protein